MSVDHCKDQLSNEGGFSFELVERNAYLQANGFKIPAAYSSGTCIAGILFEDGVMLAADNLVVNKCMILSQKVKKIHCVAENIFVATHGTLADIDHLICWVTSQLTLYRYDDQFESNSRVATHLIKRELTRFGGQMHCHCIIGGVDHEGPRLSMVHPHGSGDVIPYTALGSGFTTANTYLEMHWKPDMCKDEAEKILTDAVKKGMATDANSGSAIDVVIIHRDRSVEQKQVPGKPVGRENKKENRPAVVQRPKVQLEVVSEMVIELKNWNKFDDFTGNLKAIKIAKAKEGFKKYKAENSNKHKEALQRLENILSKSFQEVSIKRKDKLERRTAEVNNGIKADEKEVGAIMSVIGLEVDQEQHVGDSKKSENDQELQKAEKDDLNGALKDK